jgi:pimeloyl-ACP methyl ester carboxylesterase
MRRQTIAVDGVPASFLTAGDGPPVLLLHGTWWSRVWAPVVDRLAACGLRPVAVDLPGCGRSGGQLDLTTAAVPALAAWVERFAAAIALDGPLDVAGHDIGGAIAQRLAARGALGVRRLALVNSVTYDSWPVPGVARFRDPAVVAAVSTDELLGLRRAALEAAIARPLAPEEREDYLSPWSELRVARSWMALAGEADARYTLELVDELRAGGVPTLLVWGEDDGFQPVAHAERLAADLPAATLVRVAGAGHIPTEDDPAAVAGALARFFGGGALPPVSGSAAGSASR